MNDKQKKPRRVRKGKPSAALTVASEARDNETANTVARMTFLANLGTGISIGGSARAANIGRATAYRWRASDPEFSKQWDEALESGADEIEDALRKTALEGNVAACLAILNPWHKPYKNERAQQGALHEVGEGKR